MTNLDRAVWRRICPAPSRTCSLVSELVSSVHPAALLPLHRHANAIRQASSHFWPISTPCPCSHAPACCTSARAARYPRGRDTRLTAPCRQRAAMPLAPNHLFTSRLPSPRPFAIPHTHECATTALASLLSTMPSSRFPSLLATNGMVPPIGGVFLPRQAVHAPHDPCLAVPSYRSHPSSAPHARPFICTPMHRTARSRTRVCATTAFRLRRASPPYLSVCPVHPLAFHTRAPCHHHTHKHVQTHMLTKPKPMHTHTRITSKLTVSSKNTCT
jgi:hypothetical protein